MKIGFVCLLASGLLGAFVPQASAATAYSPWAYYGPVYAHYYKNRAWVGTSSRIYAVTDVYNQSTTNVPAGYMGALARLYRNQVLCTQTGYAYNTGPAAGMSVPTTGNACGSGAYYSYGVSKAYNGNGYNAYFTYESPHVSATATAGGTVGANGSDSPTGSTRSEAVPTWHRNRQGQTYGSSMDATMLQNEPDLMQAYATNGKVGYVKRVDLESEPNPKSPQEALAAQAKLAGESRAISVYAVDGITKIGVFVASHVPRGTIPGIR
ncbi:ATP-dependent Lon protease [Streptomyces sp. NPDC020362]|uniref:ATP-dependent Lon protease n=1 Tax=unclassified Streptomyces TaxID=2593676 RepID=UPI0033ED5E44